MTPMIDNPLITPHPPKPVQDLYYWYNQEQNTIHVNLTMCGQQFDDVVVVLETQVSNPLICIPVPLGMNVTKRIIKHIDVILNRLITPRLTNARWAGEQIDVYIDTNKWGIP